MPVLHRAAWLLPIAGPPIRDGWVLVDRGRIRAVGGPEDPVPQTPQLPVTKGRGTKGPAARDLRETVAILPGLVNAHTHLELSWMRGKVAPAGALPVWASRLIALRRTVPSESMEPIPEAVRELRAAGTSLIGEVTNTLEAWDALAGSDLSAVVFRELLGFNAADPDNLVRIAHAELDALTPLPRIRTAVVPHAPYSVSPALLRAIAGAAGDGPLSVHLGESREELEFLQVGTGAWRLLLEALGVWTDAWRAPRCWPVEYLDRFGLVDKRLLAVHCVQLSDAELSRLAEAGATVVTCPRSNRWTGAGTPPVERFYASGARVAIGTDSLASVEDLSLFAELAVVRSLAPAVRAARILRSATLDGAEALGFAGELGSIQPGKRAALIAVRIPPDVEDVEEYLLSNVAAKDIRWLDPD
ncbi:MAG TPA: amidohydrolase family protein [Vicinamibacterales bacterium]|nr:amidohydrolase family protein [Vicinamibacterales bacterium]